MSAGIAGNRSLEWSLPVRIEAEGHVKVVKFIDQIKGELGEAPAPPPKQAKGRRRALVRVVHWEHFNS